MTAQKHDDFRDRLPDEMEIENADTLRKVLAASLQRGRDTELNLAQGNGEILQLTLMPALANTLMDLLRLISEGKGFRMIPVEAELTSQQAADILNVSRPYLIKLLDSGEIAFRKTGRHRRIRAADLFEYKERRDSERANALSELAKTDADLGLL